MRDKINSALQFFKIKYAAIGSQKKVAVVVGVLIGLVLLGIYSTYPNGNTVKNKKKQEKVVLSDDEYVREKWLGSAERKVQELKREVQELREQVERLKNQGDHGYISSSINNSGQHEDEIDVISKRINEVIAQAPVKKPKLEELAPPSPVYPDKELSKKRGSDNKNKVVANAMAKALNGKNKKGNNKVTTGKNQDKGKKEEVSSSSMAVIEIAGSGEENKGPDREDQAEKQQTLYIPPTTFVEGMLLTGLDAPTGVKAAKAPHPVMIRLQDLSFLPNEVRQNILGCRLLGEGYGELSSERAYIRLVSLSCVDFESKEVVSAPAKGYVADNDGKIGLRGEVVSKQGMFLARSLISAFIEGVAQGFKTTQQTVVATDSGTVTTTNPIEGFGDGFMAGVSSGAAKSAEKLSEFYLKLAEEMFPVIEIGALRHVTVVFTGPIEAKFEKKFS